MKLSGSFIKQSLSAHSWIGLLVSTLMYIVCLTGTLCVFYPEFQRWEKANVDESLAFEISALQKGVNDAIANEEILTSHMYVYLPTEERPFLSLANEKQDWYVNHDGSLGNVVESKWTDFLIDMHLYLTIPNSVGMMLVSILGAMLCALREGKKILPSTLSQRIDDGIESDGLAVSRYARVPPRGKRTL